MIAAANVSGVEVGAEVDRLQIAEMMVQRHRSFGRTPVGAGGEKFSIAFHAGGGFEYQIENRHYAFGLAADGFLLPQFDAMRAIDSRLYLRYTY